VISYNRRVETLRTIQALKDTGAMEQAEVVIWDNGSVDGTGGMLWEMETSGGLGAEHFISYGSNIGCPRALNHILCSWREPGQHFIKVDNDVLVTTFDWVDLMCQFLEDHPDVGMASPYYEEIETAPGRQGKIKRKYEDWWEVFPVIGHCVIHRGKLLDEAGFFDVLAGDHLYGFEDLLMAHRAGALGYKCAVNLDVRLVNIQRKNSLDSGLHVGESRVDHIARLRPEYNRRIHRIHLPGGYHVGPDGQEIDHV
jgi:GT2 family glycosyltransferase